MEGVGPWDRVDRKGHLEAAVGEVDSGGDTLKSRWTLNDTSWIASRLQGGVGVQGK